MSLDARLFTQSLDKLLSQLQGLSDTDISSRIEGSSHDEPLAAVKITKISGPKEIGPETTPEKYFRHSENDGDGCDMEGEGDDDSDLEDILSQVSRATGEEADPEWLKETGRDPREFAKQFSNMSDDEDDEEALFPDEKLTKLLGKRR